MIGFPKYHEDERVSFSIMMSGSNQKKIGKIYIVDAYGTFFNRDDVSYDIYVEKENCVYKHVLEDNVASLTE